MMTRFAKTDVKTRLARQRGAFLALAFSCVGAVIAHAPNAHAQDADVLLQQMRAAEAKTQYSATQIRVRGGTREVAKIERDGLKRRLEWLAPDARRGDILTDNGRTVSLYHRADNTVTQTNSSARVPNFGTGWKAKREGDTFLLTRGAQRLRLDAERKILLSFANGANTTVLENLRFGSIPDSRFSFSTPRGAKVTKVNGIFYTYLGAAQAAQKWFKAPVSVPGNYNFESAVVSGDEAWLRYSNGARRLSIFQQKADGASVAPREVDGSTFWKSDGVRFLVTGGTEADRRAFVGALR